MEQHQISNEIINEVRERTNIVEVISEYVQLTKKGRNYFGLCPFHDDRSPSMSVSEDKQIYRCFSCGAGGNAFTFLMEHENISFPKALQMLANRSGIELNIAIEDSVQNKGLSNETVQAIQIHELAAKYYEFLLTNTTHGKLAMEYLTQRGIDFETIKKFKIGLALDQFNSLTQFLKSKGISEKDGVTSTLIMKSEHGYFDRFRNRIMFPLFDIQGNIIGYSGRIFSPSSEPKYVNSPESICFKKGEILYNYHQAKGEIRKKQRCILMEGFLDVIRANTIGINECVASMGTALTHQQAKLIRRLTDHVIICYDGDDAGQLASLKAIDELERIGCNVSIVTLKDKLDPDEYIKKYGSESFEYAIDNALPVIEFKINYYRKNVNINNTQELSNYLHNILNIVKNVNNEIDQMLYLRKISNEVNISVEDLQKHFSKITKKNSLPEQKPVRITVPEPMNKYLKAEQMLVAYMLNSIQVANIYKKQIGFLPSIQYRALANLILAYYEKGNEPNIAQFINEINNDIELVKLVTYLESLELVKKEYSIEEINDYVKIIKEYNVELQIKQLEIEMKETDHPLEKAKIAERIRALNMKR